MFVRDRLASCSFLRLAELYRFPLCVLIRVSGFSSLLHHLEKQKVQDGVMKIREEDRLWANSVRSDSLQNVYVFTEMTFSAESERERLTD